MDVFFFDSFDYYATADLATRYHRVGGPAQSAGLVVPGKGRRGSQGFMGAGGAQGSMVGRNISEAPSGSTLYAGAAYYFPQSTSFDVSAGPTLIHLRNMNHFGEVGSMLHLTIAADGSIALDLYGGADTVRLWTSDTDVIRFGQGWQYVELAVELTFWPTPALNPPYRYYIAYYAVRVDAELLVEEDSLLATDFLRGWTGFDFRAPGGVQMDDPYVGGGGRGEFLGDVSALRLRPTGAGDVTEWTPDPASLAAGTANWDCVDEVLPDDTDAVQSNTAGARDRYAFEDLPATLPADTPVFAVAVDLRAMKLDAGPRVIGTSVISGGQLGEAGEFALGDEPTLYQGVYPGAPTGTAWTVAAVNALLGGPYIPDPDA